MDTEPNTRQCTTCLSPKRHTGLVGPLGCEVDEHVHHRWINLIPREYASQERHTVLEETKLG